MSLTVWSVLWAGEAVCTRSLDIDVQEESHVGEKNGFNLIVWIIEYAHLPSFFQYWLDGAVHIWHLQ